MGIITDFNNNNCFSIFLNVANGSPGPFDKKIPFGFNLISFSNEKLQGKTTIKYPIFSRSLSIFLFTPKSITAIKFLFVTCMVLSIE